MKKILNLNSRVRRERGQTTLGIVSGLAVMVAVFVLLVMFGLNVFSALKYGADLKLAATEAANIIQANKFWLGMKRPDYNQGLALEKATRIADAVSVRLGLPPIEIVEVMEDDTPASDIVVVKVRAKNLLLPFATGAFPSFLTLKAEGISVQSKNCVYACVDIATKQPGQNNPNVFDVMRVPAYGFSRNTASGQTVEFAGQQFAGNFSSSVDANGFTGPNGFENGFGATTPFDSKYFRGVVLAAPSAFDPRLAGTAQFGLSN